MAPPKDPKKKIEECQKAIHGEVKKLSLRMRKSCDAVEKLVEVKEKIESGGEIGPKEKETLGKIDVGIEAIRKSLSKDQNVASTRLTKMLRDYAKGDAKEAAALEKGLDSKFVNTLKSLLLLPTGKNTNLTVGIDFKKLKSFKIDTLLEVPKLKFKGKL